MKRCKYQLIRWSVLILPCNQQLYLFCVKNRKNRLACRWRNTVILKDECKKPDRVINKHIWLFISYILAKKMFNHHIKIPSNSIIFSLASLGWFSNRRNVSNWQLLTTGHANQTTGLANSRAANWATEVEFSLFHALSRCQMMFPVSCWISLL